MHELPKDTAPPERIAVKPASPRGVQETLRFGVASQGGEVTAVLTRTTWESHQAASSDATLGEIYRSNRPLIDAAVQRRLARGDRGPVQLRPADPNEKGRA